MEKYEKETNVNEEWMNEWIKSRRELQAAWRMHMEGGDWGKEETLGSWLNKTIDDSIEQVTRHYREIRKNQLCYKRGDNAALVNDK